MAWTERYVRADAAGGGNGTTDANSGANGAWTLAEAVTNEAAGQRINIRAGTYANAGSQRTFAATGTTTAPIWLRGYTSTAGDLDATPPGTTRVAGTDIPHFTFTGTAYLAVTGAHHIVSNISSIGAATAGGAYAYTSTSYYRCRFENTAASAGATAMTCAGSDGPQFIQCWFRATTTATRSVYLQVSAWFYGCTFEGGGHQVDMNSTGSSVVLAHCAFIGAGDCGFKATLAPFYMYIIGCTFRDATNDGIRITVAPTNKGLIASCLFASNGGWGINQNSGTNTAFTKMFANDFWDNTSGTFTGFGDVPAVYDQADSSDPNTSSSDLSLVVGALAKGTGLPGLFENAAFRSYLDIGAVQRQEPNPTLFRKRMNSLGR